MNSKSFQEFLAKQTQVKSAEDQVDWEAKKTEWIKYASDFTDSVTEFLAEFSEITTQVVDVEITEKNLGTYKAPKLLIRLPKELIELEPVGTLLIGAHGRFDMKGLAGTVKWVLVPENAEKPVIKLNINDEDENLASTPEKLTWKLATPAPNIRYLPFNKEILLEAIMEVSHG